MWRRRNAGHVSQLLGLSLNCRELPPLRRSSTPHSETGDQDVRLLQSSVHGHRLLQTEMALCAVELTHGPALRKATRARHWEQRTETERRARTCVWWWTEWMGWGEMDGVHLRLTAAPTRGCHRRNSSLWNAAFQEGCLVLGLSMLWCLAEVKAKARGRQLGGGLGSGRSQPFRVSAAEQ